MDFDFIKLAKKRYSSRLYKTQEVEKNKILTILEAARIAPSAANKQPWLFYVIRKEADLKSVKECYPRAWFNDVPLIIVACADYNQSWKRADSKNHADIDIAIAVDHMSLAASSVGLGSCWVCNFNKELLVTKLQLPSHIEPIAMLAVGYSEDESNTNRHTSSRKLMTDIVRWEI